MYYGSDPWMQAAPEFYEIGDEIITTDAAGHLQHYANPFGGSPIAYTLDPGTVTTAPTSSRRSHNYHQHLQMQLQRPHQHQHQHQHHNPQQTYFASEQPPQLWASPRSSSDDDSSSSSSSPPQSPKLVLRERERKLSYQPAAVGMYSRSNRSPTAARASVGGRPRNFTTGGGAEMRQQFAPLRSWVPEDQHHRHNPAPVAKTPTKGAASPKVGRSPKAGRSPRAGASSQKSTKEVKQFLEAPLRPGTNLINKGQFAEVPMMLCDRSPTAQDASPTSSLAHIGAFRRANAERGPGLPTAPYPPSPFIVPTTHLPPKPSGGAW